MRLALLVSSDYKKSSQLPVLASATLDAELMLERFSEPDARALVERLDAGPKLEVRLERMLERHCREPEQSVVLFYFSGHIMLRDDGEPALLLDSRRGGSLALSRVRDLLREAAAASLAVLDLVHAPDAEDLLASATVVGAVRDALEPKRSGIGVLVGARPSDRFSPPGPSRFTRLFLLALERLTPTRARSGAVRVGAVYEEMRAEEEHFHEIPSAGFFRGAGDFALLEMPSIVIAADVEASAEASAEAVAPVAAGVPRVASSRPAPPVASVDELFDEGDAAAGDGRYEEAIASYKRALLGLRSRRGARHAELYIRIGRAKRALGSDTEAVHNFDKALVVDPLDGEAFSAVVELLEKRADYAHLDRLHRRRVEALRSDEDRAQAWRALAGMWLHDAKDPKRALGPIESWLALRPSGIEALEQWVEVQVQLGKHAAAVAARRRLADALDGDSSRRAGVLVEAAREAALYLPDKTQAIELCRQALEADPSRLEALEIVASLLAKKRRWPELAALYESVLDRTRDAHVAWDLAKKLGMLCRDELDDAEGAKRAFLRALQHEPDDVELRYRVADLYEAGLEPALAADQLRAATRYKSDDPDLYRRALGLFEKSGEADSAWSAASVLDLLGEADINESLAAGAHRPDGLIAARDALGEDAWSARLFYPERERELPAVLGAVSSAAIALSLERLERAGRLPELDPATRQNPGQSTAMLTRSLVWTSRLLGVPMPALYVSPEIPGALVLVPAAEPTAVAARALGSGLGLPELAFLWGRHLSFYRPEHYLLAFYPTLRDVASLLVAALSLGGHPTGEPLEGDAAELSERLDQTLAAGARERLESAVAGFDTRNVRRRIVAWMRSVQLAGGRAGLLACGDLHLAAALTERFSPPGGPGAAEDLADLRAYSISREYAELRERLGVGVKG